MVIFHHRNLEVLVVQALVLSEYCLQVCKVLNKKLIKNLSKEAVVCVH